MAGTETAAPPFHLPGFTPVRRPECKITGLSPVIPQEPPWTTSRCHRLLRPLSAAIIELRKQRYSTVTSKKPRDRYPQWQILRDAEPDSHESNLTAVSTSRDNEDPEWAPGRFERRATRTYSSRTGPRRAPDTVPETKIRTVKLGDPGSLIWIIEKAYRTHPRPNLPERLAGNVSKDECRAVARAVTEKNHRLHAEIYTALESLLTRTSKSSAPSTSCSSLFKLCLKAVPKRIALEQKLELERDPNSEVDLSDVIYSELEALGSSRSGWKSLRIVVRSHGIHMLGEAIAEGLIPPRISQILLKLCYREGATDEAEQLATSMLASIKAVAPPTATDQPLFCSGTAETLSVLKEYWVQSGAWNHLFRALAQLLEQETLPVSWMGSPDMQPVWYRVLITSIEHMAKGRGYKSDGSYALVLLKTTLSLSCCALQGTFRSQLHMLRLKTWQTSLSQSELTEQKSSKDSLTSTMHRLLAAIIGLVVGHHDRTIALHLSPTIAEAFAEVWYMLQFSKVTGCHFTTEESRRLRYLIFTQMVMSGKHVPGLSDSFNEMQDQLSSAWQFGMSRLVATSDLAAFGCSAARCCEECFPTHGHSHVRELVGSVINTCESGSWPPLDGDQAEAKLRRTASELAFAYAEWSHRQSDLVWALELEDLYVTHYTAERRRRLVDDLDAAKRNPNWQRSFRWEESLGEWVVRTPAVNKSKVKDLQTSDPKISSEHPIPRWQHSLDGCVESELPVDSPRPRRHCGFQLLIESGSLLDLSATPSAIGKVSGSPIASFPNSPTSAGLAKPFDLSLMSDEPEDELSVAPHGAEPTRHEFRRSVLSEVIMNERSEATYVEAKEEQPKPRQRGRPKRQRSEPGLGAIAKGGFQLLPNKRRRSSRFLARGFRASSYCSSKENYALVAASASESEDELGRCL